MCLKNDIKNTCDMCLEHYTKEVEKKAIENFKRTEYNKWWKENLDNVNKQIKKMFNYEKVYFIQDGEVFKFKKIIFQPDWNNPAKHLEFKLKLTNKQVKELEKND